MSARPSGPLNRLLSPFVNPGVFDFWAQQIRPDWSWDRPLATVVERRLEARDTVTLTLKLNRHCQLPQPGQHINVSAEIDGRRVTRSYSPTRVDPKRRTLDITVRQVLNGVVSSHLVHNAQVGDVLELGDAFGCMTWPAGVGGKWLMLAAGSGITPLISLIRQAQQSASPADITLIYWAKTRADLCFATELRSLAAHNPNFRFYPVLTQEAERLDDEAAGRLDNVLLNSVVTDLSLRQVFACGPSGFVDTARSLTAGIALQFEAEAFTPAAPLRTDAASQPVRITLQSTGRTVTVPSGQALLPALEAQGLSVPHGCRMGICNTCSCTKVSGTTQDLQSGDRLDEPNSAVRLCVSSAQTDLTLDL